MGIVNLITELFRLMSLETVLLLAAATSLGMIIGALPGLTATMGIALLTGITYGMDTTLAIVVLMGIYVGAIYGGSFSAIMLNIPGTGSAAATALDGFPLAQQGLGARAKGYATVASFFGTVAGMVALVTIAPLISRMALSFTSFEFTLLAVMGLLICGSLTATDLPVKGWIAAVLGVLLSTVGIDELHGYGRFTYGRALLMTGIAFVPAMIGVFGIPQIITAMKSAQVKFTIPRDAQRLLPPFKDFVKMLPNAIRSGLIGIGIGAIPGVGEDVAAWMAYDVAKRTSKEPEKFGKGAFEGVMAAETANNAAIGGAIIPLLTLGIPGSPPAAILLGALLLHGIRPGPLLTFEFPNFLAEMSAILVAAAAMMVVCGLLLNRVIAWVLTIDSALLMPIVGVLSVMGAYALNFRIFDLYVMVVLGLIYYLLTEMKYPVAPLVLGLILGPLLDVNLRRALLVSNGSLAPFVTRPVSAVLLAVIVLMLLSQAGVIGKIRNLLARGRVREQQGSA